MFKTIADIDPNAETPAAYQDRFNAALIAFVNWYQDYENDRFRTNYPNLDGPLMRHETGSKNIRVVSDSTGTRGQRSVICFVRRSDGAILKAAGWKAPFIAKGGPSAPMTVRGSIFNIASFIPARWA